MAGRGGRGGAKPGSGGRGGSKGGAAGRGGSKPGSGGRGGSSRPARGRGSDPARPARGPSGRAPARSGGAGSGGSRVGAPKRPAAPKGLGGMQVEGRQAVRELLLAGRRRAREVWLAADLDPSDVIEDIVELATELRVPVLEVPRRRLEEASATEASQGVLARADELPETPLDDLARPAADGVAPFLVALDGVTDPGNLGALLRTAECAGVTGVVLPRHRAVHVTPTVTKAAAGAVEHVPMALVGGLPAALAQLRDAGVWVVGLDADAEQSLFDLPVATEAVCLVLGAEGAGLSRLVRERCDLVVSIPLHGQLGSLNVSVSGALACYEIVRRRG